MPIIDILHDDDEGEEGSGSELESDHSSDWETSSDLSTSILSVRSSISAVSVVALPDQAENEISPGPSEDTPDQSRPSALDLYFIERAKLIKHLEKRAKKFTKRSKESYDRARWGKPKQKKQSNNLSPGPAPASAAAPITPFIPPLPPKVTAGTAKEDISQDMLASTSKLATRATAAIKPARTFSTTASTLKAKQTKDVTEMEIDQAVRVCRALEISSPHAVYTITVDIKPPKSTKFQSVRGRVSLPKDPRRVTDRILVFAEANSLSARLARETGVTWVGGDDLFEPLLKGEIEPTKILATPGMMPLVTAHLARFLGPKGLMPTARRGGIGEGEELVQRIREAKGAIDWKSDDQGKISAPIGRMNFEVSEVESNIRALAGSLREALTGHTPTSLDSHLLTRREAKAKTLSGVYGIHLSTTNGLKVALKDAF